MASRLIEIFRAGNFRTATGKDVSYTQQDIDEIYENYDPQFHRAAFTTDHKQDGPAWGYVEKLIKKGASLFASADDIHESLAGTLGKNFGRVSVEIWPKLENKGKYLKAVSFLGVKPPAVKGLEIFETSEALEEQQTEALEMVLKEDESGEEVRFEMQTSAAPPPAHSEPTPPDALTVQLEEARARLNELQHNFSEMSERASTAEARLQELGIASRKMEFEQYLNERIAWGSLPPALYEKVLSLLTAMENVEMFSADGSALSATDALKDVIDSFSQVIKPGVHIATKPPAPAPKEDYRTIAGRALQFQMDEKAAGRFVSIAEAVRIISKNQAADKAD